MRTRFLNGLVGLLFAAGCGFEASLGPADGVRAVRIEKDVPNPALKRDGHVVFFEDVVLLTAMDSQRYYRNLGPDKISALRGVTLELLEIRIDGLDLARSGPPHITLWDHEIDGVAGAEIELDDDEVDLLRAAMLGGTEVRAPLAITLDAPLEALDATRPELHIVLVVQPTLRVDVAGIL